MNTEFKNGRMGMHLNMSNKGILTHLFDIEAPNHPLTGKQIIKQVTTPKRNGVWGKGKVTFFLADEKSPEFTSLQEFIKHYDLPPLKSK